MSATLLRTQFVIPSTRVVRIAANRASLTGELSMPVDPAGLVVFSRTNSDALGGRDDWRLADTLRRHGFATLMFDLLTPEEELVDASTRGLRGDLALLARRLIDTIDWVSAQASTADLPLGIVGEGAGAAAAFVAACVRPDRVSALVSRAERPDHATPVLARLHTPVLLIVPSDDEVAVHANEATYRRLRGVKEIVRYDVHAGADDTDELSRLVLAWFNKHLQGEPRLVEPAVQLC